MELNGKKLLIVDDEPDLREMISFEFDLLGVNVLEASSGNEAIEVLNSNSDVDAIISDIRMPNGDGLSLLKHVAKNTNRSPFIFISGFADLSAEEAFFHGAQSIFSKPFDLQNLVDEVKYYLQTWSDRLSEKPGSVDTKITQDIESFESARDNNKFDFSAYGFYFQTPEKLAFDQVFEFDFTGNGNTLLSGVAKVKWIDKNDQGQPELTVGAEFIWLSPESNEVIKSKHDTEKYNSPFIPCSKSF